MKHRKKPKRLTLPKKYSRSRRKKKVVSHSRCAGKVLLDFQQQDPADEEVLPLYQPAPIPTGDNGQVKEGNLLSCENGTAEVDAQEQAYFAGEGEDIFIDDDSGDGSDVENILNNYDSDGMPKEKGNKIVSQLPAGFHVAKRRRFRSAYGPATLTLQNLFAKFKGKVLMIKVLFVLVCVIFLIKRILTSPAHRND